MEYTRIDDVLTDRKNMSIGFTSMTLVNFPCKSIRIIGNYVQGQRGSQLLANAMGKVEKRLRILEIEVAF